MSPLEQEAENASSDHELDLVDTSIVSIAISLKRIADAMQTPEVQIKPYIKPEQFFNQS